MLKIRDHNHRVSINSTWIKQYKRNYATTNEKSIQLKNKNKKEKSSQFYFIFLGSNKQILLADGHVIQKKLMLIESIIYNPRRILDYENLTFCLIIFATTYLVKFHK